MIAASGFIFTLIEFALSAAGCVLIFRNCRELKTAWLYLGFRVLADLATLTVLLKFGNDAAGVSNWIQKAIQYLFLCAIASQIVGRLVGERNKNVIAAGGFVISLFVAWTGTALFVAGQTLQIKILGSMCSAGMLLGIVILICRLDNARKLDATWASIMHGLVTALVTNAVFFLLWDLHFDGARRLIPLGEIAALLLWNYAGRGAQKLSGMRLPLCVRGEAIELGKAAH